jgi:HPt (histidine-containing phosphotransfer) domain-containing protein
MSADAVIDLEHLARYTGGDVALNAEILRLFETQTSELVASLRAILEARDEKSWKEVTHTIKGAARGVGAFAMADAAAQCELLGIEDPGITQMAIAKLKSETEAVQAFVKVHCAA